VTLPDNWKKSTRSQSTTNCVEVASSPSQWLVRDTKDRAGGTLDVPAAAWSAFTEQVRGQ
jgi:hypothetical protein